MYNLRSLPLRKRLVLGALQITDMFGFNFTRTVRAVRWTPRFIRDLMRYRRLPAPVNFGLSWRDLAPVLGDFRGSAGNLDPHYFHQDLWAARKIFQRRPRLHVDVGSRIDGFIAHVLVFTNVQIIDIRPLKRQVKGLTTIQADATRLENIADNSIVSLSTLNAAEHFGLGRYSDPIDPNAHEKFMAALQRVLAPGGVLYFAVPIGQERLEFNALRVFHPTTVCKYFRQLELMSFSYIDDGSDLHEDVRVEEVSNDMVLGCGLYEFVKPVAI
ncbi:MAG: DUF268 domain-containing protein [Candidatus Korobacteraceae bacterium]